MHSSPMILEKRTSGKASAGTPPPAKAEESEAPSETKILSGTNSSPLEGDLIAPYIDLTNCTKAELPYKGIAARAIMEYGVQDFTCRNYQVDSWEVEPEDPGFETDSEDDSEGHSEDEDEDSTSEAVEEADVVGEQTSKFVKGQMVKAQWKSEYSKHRWHRACIKRVNGDGTYYVSYRTPDNKPDGDKWKDCPEERIQALNDGEAIDNELHTELNLGMGIHEGEFKGEKVFLELTWLKGEPKSFVNDCGGIVHNKFISVFVEGVGRSDFIQEFLEEMIQRMPVRVRPKRRRRQFEIYRWNHCDASWRNSQAQVARKMSSVILPKGMIEKVHTDMKNFLSRATAQWYETFGIPYKRSYLFHGVPGSGKTSLITALAGKLRRNVCFLSAHHPAFSDDAMKKAMERLPENAFLIMEDIDSLFNMRNSMNKQSPLTFTGLLNCLDGIGHATGQIVIMTTNYIDRLDEALIRAGRADMWVEFTNATEWQLSELFKWFYHQTPEEATKWADTFAKNCLKKFPAGVTIAEMQQHFVDNRGNSPEDCAKGVLEYDMPMRKFMIGQKAKALKKYHDAKDGRFSDDGRFADDGSESGDSGSEKEDSNSKPGRAKSPEK